MRSWEELGEYDIFKEFSTNIRDLPGVAQKKYILPNVEIDKKEKRMRESYRAKQSRKARINKEKLEKRENHIVKKEKQGYNKIIRKSNDKR